MDGVKNHLESPDAKTRVLGMIVAENLSDLVKVSEQKEKSVLCAFILFQYVFVIVFYFCL